MLDKNGVEIRPDGGHWWDMNVQVCQDCGMRLELFEDTKASCTGKPLQEADQQWFLTAQPEEPFRWQKRESFSNELSPSLLLGTKPVETKGHLFVPGSTACVKCRAEWNDISGGSICLDSPKTLAAFDKALAKKAKVKSPAELYADFHRIVTETVAREAPKMKAVTDFGTRFHGDGIGMMWLSLGNLTELGYSPLRGNEPSYIADVLYLLDELRRKSDPLR